VTVRRRSLVVAAVLFALGAGLAILMSSGGGRRGRETDSRSFPGRVITIGPNVTETVFALGAGERVVAVTDFCTYPPEARQKARVGGLFHPNLERMIALEPDLVVMQAPMEKVIGLCKERGVDWLAVGMNDLAGIYRGIGLLGGKLGLEEEAARLRAEIESGLDDVRKRVAGLEGGPDGGGPRVKLFLCTGRAPGELSGLGTAGPGGFLAELVEIAGGENIFADAVTRYPQVSKEALTRRAPEVIIECRPGADLDGAARERLVAEWDALSSLPAVREGRVHVLTDDFLMIPGPRIVKTARRLAELLHPEAFPEADNERE
jgi:iron complex transport system substrate-binding protein